MFLGRLAEPLAGLGEDRADGVLRDAQLLADLAVILILQVVEPNDLRLAGRQALEHPFDFLLGDDRLDVLGRAVVDERPVGVGMPQLLLAMAADQLLDRDPTRDDRQVGRQRADPLEPLEDRVIIVHDLQQDLGGDILDVLGRNDAAPRVGGMLDDMVDQTHVPIDEVVPGAGLLPQAAVDEITIDVTQRHGAASSRRRRRHWRCRKFPARGTDTAMETVQFYHKWADRQPADGDLERPS